MAKLPPVEIEKLVALNEEFENYFRNTIIPQLYIDADLILRKFSPPSNIHFKLTAEDIGKSINDIPSLAQLPELVDRIIEVIKNKNDVEEEIQTNDKRWFQMNILPYIIKKQNRTNGVVITFIDITDRINDKKDIEKVNADHETFIYSVSHDFKGPLTNIVLLIELLKEAINTNKMEDINNFIEKIEKSAQSLKKIIDELTDITRIRRTSDDKPITANIEQIIAEVKFTLKDQIYLSHAKITSNLLVVELPFASKNLRSIMYNLLSNAIKFSKPDTSPEIFIKTEDTEEYVLLSVKDNGVGIKEDKQVEVFSKFTRLQPHIEGTGIGLFIIDKMVTNQGGKIEVESSTDNGTTFTIYLKK
jgi:two-component system, OmpR family, phosphate regulon sensor histidine kinase PhoR